MKKRKLAVLIGAVLAALLVGCSQQSEQEPTESNTRFVDNVPTETAGQSIVPTTEPIRPTEPPTEPTQPTEPPPSLEPVTELTSIRWKTYPQFLSLGDGNLLASQNYFEEGSGIVNFLSVFNVYNDEVLVESRNDSPRELVEQRFDDNCFVLADAAENTFYVYDENLQVKDSFSAPNVKGFFSHDRSSYYFLKDRVLYRMEVSSGNYGRMALKEDLRFESLVSIHPHQDVICARVYLSFYEEYCGLAVIDCTDGSLLMLRGDVEHIWFDRQGFYAMKTNDKVYGNDVYFGSMETGIGIRITSETLGRDTVAYRGVSGSGYMVLHTTDEEALRTTVYDLIHKGVSCELEQYGYTTSTLAPYYMEQEQLIFALRPDGYYFSPVVIDPKVLTYKGATPMDSETWGHSVDQRLLSLYRNEKEGPGLPQELTAQRDRADALEEKYGIQILMGQQVVGPWGEDVQVEEDAHRIDAALTQVETALALYPDGFLAQLRNGVKEGGIYLCLTGRIDGELTPVGKTLRVGDRYEIAIDITADGVDRTVHHEIWHAIEMKLSTDSFAHPQWDECNPGGFTYYGHYDSGYGSLTADTYGQSGPACYFVDAYSKINATEDRARLMENVMSGDASGLMQSAALKQKLSIMSKAIRDHFNTKDWQTPYWERYL